MIKSLLTSLPPSQWPHATFQGLLDIHVAGVFIGVLCIWDLLHCTSCSLTQQLEKIVFF